MAKLNNIIRSRWCGILMAILTAMGFGACHRTQKVVIDDSNAPIVDTIGSKKPPRIRDHGEIIALYGVPPSKFKNMKQQNNNLQNN
ncbi:MAG: hypothetical protein J6X05_03565 [Bacteroidales bacterium]|nr:hypothetical protein [Bacteroidales bacterium]